jgi:hypothetical protein
MAIDPAPGLGPEAVEDEMVGGGIVERSALLTVGVGFTEAVVPAQHQQGAEGIFRRFFMGGAGGGGAATASTQAPCIDPTLGGEGLLEFQEVLPLVAAQDCIALPRDEAEAAPVAVVGHVVPGGAGGGRDRLVTGCEGRGEEQGTSQEQELSEGFVHEIYPR